MTFVGSGRLRLFLIALLMPMVLMGCGSSLRNGQLKRVAKDWALTIRASQVIPVYPLTEDLQPGDVLLVSTPVQEQAAIYEERGFLPLDQHLVRLAAADYPAFYGGRYGIDPGQTPPGRWQSFQTPGKHAWDLAPHAGFPSYSFSIEAGSGMSLALPIQGVPIALGVMNTNKASGHVTIADAYTYGLDNADLYRMVHSWADANRILLSSYGPQENRYHFLRVVSRVYVTGRVDVTVINDAAAGGRLDARGSRPASTPQLVSTATAENQRLVVDALNSWAKESVIGGSLQFASASNRSVSLAETFSRPLVIGYVGFDVPIEQGGRLGPPISTLAQLSGYEPIPAREFQSSELYRTAAASFIYASLPDTTASGRLRGDLDKLAQLLPSAYTFTAYQCPAPGQIEPVDPTVVRGASVPRRSFQDVLSFLGIAESTERVLAPYLRDHPDPDLQVDLDGATNGLRKVRPLVFQDPAFVRAVDAVFFGIE